MNHITAAHHIEADAALVSRLAAGDQRALGTLYDRHGAAAYALACAITARPTVAESVIADAFAQLWREASTFDPHRMSLLAWLMSTVRSLALQARGASPASVELSGSLAALDPVQARAVELAYFGGRSRGEIARELQLTEGAVAQLLRSAIEALRRGLLPNAPVSPDGASLSGTAVVAS